MTGKQDLRKDLDINFLTFLQSLTSPVALLNANYETVWTNKGYEQTKSNLPAIEAIEKSKFQPVIVNGETKYFLYNFSFEVNKNIKGIAHDFNNLLSTILNSNEALKLKLQNKPELKAYLTTIENNAHRAAEIVEELIPSKTATDRRKKIKSSKLVDEIVDAISQTFPKDISIVKETSDLGLELFCNPTDIYRSILNICINAKEAINGKGEIRVSLKKATNKENFVLISIEDDGPGISEENLNKIFSGGFSTKSKRTESGLGLNLVKEIIEKNKGDITVISEVGKGAKFNIYLPCTKTKSKPKEEAKSTGIKKILLADDEEILRELLAELLESNGFEVVQAKNGFDAIDKFKEFGSDLLIIDRKMPELSGLECIEEIRKLNYSVPIILASGSEGSESEDRINSLGIDRKLNKPYDFEQMQMIIEELANL